MKTLNFKRYLLGTFAVLQTLALTGCALKSNEPGALAAAPAAAYCATVTTYSAPTITVSGTAYYAPRIDGNGEVADGGYRYRPTTSAVVTGVTYTITVSGTPYSYTSVNGDTAQTVTQKLAAVINNSPSALVTASALRLYESASSVYYVLVNLKTYGAWPGGSGNSATLTAVARPTPEVIRFAEIMVRDSSGSLVQCGSTDASGAYSLTLPQAASGTYTVYVNSRINSGSKARAYVLDHHLTNVHYSISKSVSATATSTANNLLASGEGSAVSGAFNILDQIIKANEFLATYVSAAHGCGPLLTYTDCTPFTAAPLVYAYWKNGVNPYSYFGVSSGSSFYVGDSKLYILGGINGDVNNSDTDHFDNSVIVHEYGHFLEDIYAISESPGGSHDANSIIDPRLAWSEGWANFLQGAVSGFPTYRDTIGNSSGTTGGSLAFPEIHLETANRDVVSGLGAEGLFREFSISRLLWDAIDPHPASSQGGSDNSDNISTSNSMAEIWTVFAGANGFSSGSNRFRHMGTFHKIQKDMGITNWAALRGDEFQNGNATYTDVGFREYGANLVAGSCSLSMDPVSDGGTFATSNQLVNNDFFAYYHSGGTLTVQLLYSTTAYANPPDLDLYVYKSDYSYGTSSSMIGFSQNDRPTGCSAGNPAPCTNSPETVSASAPAGHYMINIMAYTPGSISGGGLATYTLSVGGTQMCPATP